MLDTVHGLPVHVLVIHAVVVGVPVMALATAVVAFVPRLRARHAWTVAVLDALVAANTWLAKESGERLQARIGSSPPIARHAELGGQLLWMTLAMVVAAVLVALVRRSTGAGPTVLAALALVASLAAVAWVVRTGEAGTSVVWGDVVRGTTPPG